MKNISKLGIIYLTHEIENFELQTQNYTYEFRRKNKIKIIVLNYLTSKL